MRALLTALALSLALPMAACSKDGSEAEGVATIVGAARLLGVSQSRADQLWQRIRRELGPQAQ